MNIDKITDKEFRATLADGRSREWYITFTRAHKGCFPAVKKIERAQDNGRFDFVTLYRPSCHGDLPTIIEHGIKEAAQAVRLQA